LDAPRSSSTGQRGSCLWWNFAAPNTALAVFGKRSLGAHFQTLPRRSDVVPRHKCRKARIAIQRWDEISTHSGKLQLNPRRRLIVTRMAQTGTPPPIRIAGTGFRGPGNMRKSQSPAYRTQIGRPEFLARCFQDRLPIAASRFCYVSAVEKVGSEIVRERELPTADIPGSMMKEGCWRPGGPRSIETCDVGPNRSPKAWWIPFSKSSLSWCWLSPSSVGSRTDAQLPRGPTSRPDFRFCWAISSTRARTEMSASISLS
jgi:hypothetical protein